MRHFQVGLAFVVAIWLMVAASFASEEIIDPLRPPDTSSPGATLASFLENTRAAYETASKVRESFISSDRHRLSSEEIALLKRYEIYINRAIQCLDLSKMPRAVVERQAPETVILLKEVLDRLEIPPIDKWPTVGSQGDNKFEK